MTGKIIIRAGDFNNEVFSFLTKVGADIPIEWDTEALDRVKNTVVEVYQKMGVRIEIDDRNPVPAHL